MIPNYLHLEPTYAKLLDAMQIVDESAIEHRMRELLAFRDRYAQVNESRGVPIPILIALNEREDGSNFGTYLGNGQSLHRVTTLVPRGRGPFDTWEAGADDALHLDGLDQYAGRWTMELACYLCEKWNGFGYLARGLHSPYDWAWSSVVSPGKFTGDGHFDASARDTQMGCIPMIHVIGILEPELALPRAIEAAPAAAPEQGPPPIPPAPAQLAASPDDVKALQVFLNKIEGIELIVDGSYGRKTRWAVQEYETSAGLWHGDGVADESTVRSLIRTIALDDKAWTGDDTMLMQALLNDFGSHPKLGIDGINGTLTKDAIIAFQDTNGIEMTGTITPETIAAVQDKLRRGL